MFRRRKPEDPPAGEPASNALFGGHGEALSGGPAARGDAGAAARQADSGLGVPPFRPAPPKEASSMSRPPFSPSPASGAPPATAPAGPRPAGGPGRPPVRDPAERRTLVVGRGISVQGTVQDAERLVVEGTVEASLIHALELSVSPGGIFKGEVEVEDAEVAGIIDGTLTARGNLIVRTTGKLLGAARCRRLQVEDGGQITGRIEMITEPVRAAAPGAPTVPASQVPAPAAQD